MLQPPNPHSHLKVNLEPCFKNHAQAWTWYIGLKKQWPKCVFFHDSLDTCKLKSHEASAQE